MSSLGRSKSSEETRHWLRELLKAAEERLDCREAGKATTAFPGCGGCQLPTSNSQLPRHLAVLGVGSWGLGVDEAASILQRRTLIGRSNSRLRSRPSSWCSPSLAYIQRQE